MTRRIWTALPLTGLCLAATLLFVSGCGGDSPASVPSDVSSEATIVPSTKAKGGGKVEEFDDLKARRQQKRQGVQVGSS